MLKLTIALTKGRILQETLPILKAADIVPAEDISKSRKLAFATSQTDVQLLILRGSDVPTYVQFGAADLGICGQDTLMECGGSGLYTLADLGIARCKLMTAGLKNVPQKMGRIRVATKYLNVARSFYAEQGRQADFIKLYGAMELAPLMGLADEIVDVVDTGNTLRANGLEARTEIAKISSRLIANKASMKMKHRSIQALVGKIKAFVEV
ncbi:MAG: ATP phosphoribosyltransferase [Cellvibrionaceae bacterium]|jgi:ATP phosphoribosyltransferase